MHVVVKRRFLAPSTTILFDNLLASFAIEFAIITEDLSAFLSQFYFVIVVENVGALFTMMILISFAVNYIAYLLSNLPVRAFATFVTSSVAWIVDFAIKVGVLLSIVCGHFASTAVG